MKQLNEKQLKEFDELGVERPSQDSHGEDSWANPISQKLKSGNPRNWKMEGHLLICDTDFGPFHQWMPTDVICKGTDANGLPILVET